MRISLKQTILLSTALFALNLPLSAIEEEIADKPKTAESSAKIAPNGPCLEKATKMSKNFFGKEVPESIPVFQSIAELLGEKKVAATPPTQLTNDTAAFTSGTLTLTAEHRNRPHPDFNVIYTELGDNFLETVLPDEVEGKKTGTTETIERLAKIHGYFKTLIDDTTGRIQQHQASLTAADTDATKSAAEELITQYNNLNNSLKERFLNLLHHFSATRKFIIQANKTIASKKMVIENTSSKDLSIGNIGESSTAISAQLEKDITYLKKLMIEAETLIHTLYDFDRTDRDLMQTPNLLGKGVVLLQSALSSAAGIITNVHSENRTLRREMTGESVLPRSINISAIFNSETCYGATDTEIHTRYMEYIQKIIKPTPALFDAIAAERIRFTEPHAIAEKSDLSAPSAQSHSAAADSKATASGTDNTDEKGTVLQALDAAADLSNAETKGSPSAATSSDDTKGKKKEKKDKKPVEGSTPASSAGTGEADKKG